MFVGVLLHVVASPTSEGLSVIQQKWQRGQMQFSQLFIWRSSPSGTVSLTTVVRSQSATRLSSARQTVHPAAMRSRSWFQFQRQIFVESAMKHAGKPWHFYYFYPLESQPKNKKSARWINASLCKHTSLCYVCCTELCSTMYYNFYVSTSVHHVAKCSVP